MTTPTIGRNVHFYPPTRVGTTPTPTAAMITGLYTEDGSTTYVDLTTFPRGDAPEYRIKVPHSDKPSPGHWNWPPLVK